MCSYLVGYAIPVTGETSFNRYDKKMRMIKRFEDNQPHFLPKSAKNICQGNWNIIAYKIAIVLIKVSYGRLWV